MLIVCGIDELALHSSRGITHVLSILDPECPDPEALLGYDRHDRTLLRFHDVIEPRPGIVPPDRHHVRSILELARTLANSAERGQERRLLIHCQAGVSRSTAAVAVLMAKIFPGQDEDSIFRRLAVLRPQAWPNSRMIRFADELLSLEGRLTRALGRFYAQQLTTFPDHEKYMREHRRTCEVEMGLQHRVHITG